MDFPSNPTLNQVETVAGRQYKWNGEGWDPVITDPMAVYTPEDVLAKLQTVDGTGSGLDADLLDGQEGAYYQDLANATGSLAKAHLPTLDKTDVGLANVDNTSDVNKPVSSAQQTALNAKVDKVNGTATDALTITSTGDATLTIEADTGNNPGTEDANPTLIFSQDGRLGQAWIGFDSGNDFYIQPRNTGSQTDSIYRKSNGGTKYLVWDQGNDGTGSGLDADLLDGQQGSYYLDQANFTGVLGVAKGGTGLASYTIGNFLYASGATTIGQRTPVQVLTDIGGAAANHKYHTFNTGDYFYDIYSQPNFLRLFIENSMADAIRFAPISNVEYWDGSAWSPWAAGASEIQNMLDGREETQGLIDHTHRKFRFQVTRNTGWTATTLFAMQTTWSYISNPDITVTLENNVSGTWTVRDTCVFNGANTIDEWGTHMKVVAGMHDGITATRITVDITDWTDDAVHGAYVVQIKRLLMLSNYTGSSPQPWSWNYSKVVDFKATPTVLGNSLWHAGNFDPSLKLDSSSYTAADVLTKIKTVDGAGSGLDADTLDGQSGAFYQNASNINAGTLAKAYLPALVKGDVGLGNVDNTTDANKPISIATQNALDLKQNSLGFTPENTANKGVANGYAGLDATGKVPAAQLPSFVDDVLEYTNQAAFPVTGSAGVLYVALDTNKCFRWSGTLYIEISASPGSTDAVAEGSLNLYFTNARAQAAITGGASTIATANLTVNRALQSDGSGKVVVSAVTNTELGFLSGVTSGIQSQLGNKLDTTSYTASDVLTKIKTVDGAASGLDADLLDAQDGSYYLAAANFTGTLADARLSTNIPLKNGANVFTNMQSISAGTATVATDYLHLTPTDYGVGKPYLYFKKEVAATQWTIGLWDSASNTGTLDLNASVLTKQGQVIWHAGNLTPSNYAPLTGAGASGTWGISVTGNAATATKLATARNINGVAFDGTADITVSAANPTVNANSLLGNNTGAAQAGISLTAAQAKTLLTLVKADVGLGNVDNTSDATKPVSSAQQTALNLKADKAAPTFTGDITLSDDDKGMTLNGGARVYKKLGGGLRLRRHTANTDPMVESYDGLSAWTIWHAGNFTPGNYAPLTGAGTSGTWGISVTGNAGTATALQTARAFSISGVVAATNVNFDGTGAVVLNTTIADGALAIAKTAGLQTALDSKQASLGYTAEDAANKGAVNGYASLDGTGKVPSSQLPSFVDDVLEYANFAALPGTGSAGLLYVTLDNNKVFRWSGSAYVEISGSPGSTDAVPEGSLNLYFTNARAQGAITGGASTIATANLTASRALVSDASGKVAVSAALSSEVGFLSGVTSAIQTQLDGKLASSGYTAADVLAKLLTVDGTTSGLDADLLDGQDGAYYLNAANLTGTLNAARSWALTGDVTSPAGSSSTTIAGGAVTLPKMSNLAANSIIGNNTIVAATPIALTGAQVKTMLALGKADVGLGNVDNTSDVNKPVSTAQQNALDGKLTIGFGMAMPSDDCNLALQNGWYNIASTTTNVPSGVGSGSVLLVSGWSSTNTTQTIVNRVSDRVYYRRQTSGVWGQWYEAWHSSNFDPTLKADVASPTFTGTATADAFTTAGAITAGSVLANAGNITTSAASGRGFGFWGNQALYGLYMSSATDATYGGRVGGETTSDYNMYFKMTGGTNRGFNFMYGGSVVAGIDGGGNGRFAGIVDATRFTAGYDSGTANSFNCSGWFRSSGNSGWYNQTWSVGIYATDATYVKTYSNGNKPMMASDFVIASDRRLKTAIRDFEYNGRLRPVNYSWKRDGKPDVGFIAQEVQELYPDVVGVTNDDDGTERLNLSYPRLTAVLSYQVNRVEDQVAELKTQLAAVESDNSTLRSELANLRELVEKLIAKQ